MNEREQILTSPATKEMQRLVKTNFCGVINFLAGDRQPYVVKFLFGWPTEINHGPKSGIDVLAELLLADPNSITFEEDDTQSLPTTQENAFTQSLDDLIDEIVESLLEKKESQQAEQTRLQAEQEQLQQEAEKEAVAAQEQESATARAQEEDMELELQTLEQQLLAVEKTQPLDAGLLAPEENFPVDAQEQAEAAIEQVTKSVDNMLEPTPEQQDESKLEAHLTKETSPNELGMKSPEIKALWQIIEFEMPKTPKLDKSSEILQIETWHDLRPSFVNIEFLFQTLCDARFTGSLSINSSSHQGKLWLTDGRPTLLVIKHTEAKMEFSLQSFLSLADNDETTTINTVKDDQPIETPFEFSL